MKIPDKIMSLAHDKGYASAEYIGEFNGFRVYEAIYRSGAEKHSVGLPAYVLEKDGEAEWVQDKRSFEIIGFFYGEED